MPTYTNGYIPENLLVIFKRGWSKIDGDWYWGLPPATYARHLALVALARKRNPNVTLTPTAGFSCYRPYWAQVIAQKVWGNGAATPGTSSHGGYWERRQTLAIDYHNWGQVYGWNQAAWFADARAVGLTPGMIMRSRGYPDEPWHVIDLDPWGAVPAFAGVSTPFAPAQPIIEEEEDMPGIRIHHQVFTNGNQAYVVETETGFLIPPAGHLAALVKAYDIDLSKLPAVNEYDWNAVQYAKTYSNSGYPQASGVSEAQIQSFATAAASAVAAVVKGVDSAQIVTDIEDRLRGYFAAIPDAVVDEQRDRLES
jgi:hypothetical protein